MAVQIGVMHGTSTYADNILLLGLHISWANVTQNASTAKPADKFLTFHRKRNPESYMFLQKIYFEQPFCRNVRYCVLFTIEL